MKLINVFLKERKAIIPDYLLTFILVFRNNAYLILTLMNLSTYKFFSCMNS